MENSLVELNLAETVQIIAGRQDLISDEKVAEIVGQLLAFKKTLAFDLSTKEGVKEFQAFKSRCKKASEQLNEFCKPFEAEGKKIADARSKINTTLSSGKDNIAAEWEKELETLKAKEQAFDRQMFFNSYRTVKEIDDKLEALEFEKKQSFEYLYKKDEYAVKFIEAEKHLLTEKQAVLELAELARIKQERETAEREAAIAEAKALREANLKLAEEKRVAEEKAKELEKNSPEAVKILAEAKKMQGEMERKLAEMEAERRQKEIERAEKEIARIEAEKAQLRAEFEAKNTTKKCFASVDELASMLKKACINKGAGSIDEACEIIAEMIFEEGIFNEL